MDTGSIYSDIERVVRRIEEIKGRFRKIKSYYGNLGNFNKKLKDKVSGSESQTVENYAKQKKPEEANGVNRKEKDLENSTNNRKKPDNEGKVIRDRIIEEAAKKYGLPEQLIRALIKQESNFNANAVSKKGAMGLMQLMPETAKLLGVENPFNIEENIIGGTRYLRTLIDLYGGNLNKALAAYNAGPSRVKENIPDIPETQKFIESVIKNYQRYMKFQSED